MGDIAAVVLVCCPPQECKHSRSKGRFLFAPLVQIALSFLTYLINTSAIDGNCNLNHRLEWLCQHLVETLQVSLTI